MSRLTSVSLTENGWSNYSYLCEIWVSTGAQSAVSLLERIKMQQQDILEIALKWGGQFMVAAQANPLGALFLLGLVALVLYMPVALAAMARTARSRRH